MTQPLIRSASKRQFLEALGLNGNDSGTENQYWLMKVPEHLQKSKRELTYTRKRQYEHTKRSYKAEVTY